jgi:hypothetical protein
VTATTTVVPSARHEAEVMNCRRRPQGRTGRAPQPAAQAEEREAALRRRGLVPPATRARQHSVWARPGGVAGSPCGDASSSPRLPRTRPRARAPHRAHRPSGAGGVRGRGHARVSRVRVKAQARQTCRPQGGSLK